MHGQPADTLPAAEVTLEAEKASLLKQPKAVWATALGAVFAFMGIGLVDPILPAIAKNLDASPSQVSLLFTSYFLVTAVAMLITGYVSSRIGGKRTLLIGLAVIVGVASGGAGTAIILYEAALGLGISLGPLLGALLGGWQWRAPFFGTAVLMASAFIALIALLPKTPLPERKVRLRDPLLALGHKGLRTTAASGLLYNYGFFTVLAFTPFILGMDAYGIGGVLSLIHI